MTSHGALFFWGRHLSQDICHPRKSRLFPHPRDILVHGDEIDSGGSVTLGVYFFIIVTLIIFPCSFSARYLFNTLRPRWNRRHFADDIFKCILLNETVLISIKISLKFIPKGPINYIPALVPIMAWRRPGDKPLSEPMMIISLTHICVTRPQWVNIPSADSTMQNHDDLCPINDMIMSTSIIQLLLICYVMIFHHILYLLYMIIALDRRWIPKS